MGIDMEIMEVKTKKEKKEFLRFVYDLYKGDPQYRDMNLTFVKTFLYGQDGYVRRQKVLPVRVREGNAIKAECIFVIDETREIKCSFLEFAPDAKPCLLALRGYAQDLMRTHDKDKTVVGVNGQISYGLGILIKATDRTFEFNSNYNKAYYAEVLDEVFSVKKRAFSYEYDAAHSLSLIDGALLEKVEAEYDFRYFDLKHFKRDMLLFGELCHASLQGTPYYSEKKPYEMYELMRQIRFLMKREDILFARKDGKEIGFIYTHPDYAEDFGGPRLNYLTFYLRYLCKRPKYVIYNVIGVLPEHQASGVAVALIHRSILMRKEKFPKGVSSFILEENLPSTRLCKKLSTGVHKEFRLYELEREQHEEGCQKEVDGVKHVSEN